MPISLSDKMRSFWFGKTVLITGHTGFKGAWLSLWLSQAGAKVHGISLAPENIDNMFDVLNLAKHLAGHTILDINDLDALWSKYQSISPDFVFHLAAQALVRPAHSTPVATFATNIMGTAHVLDCIRRVQIPTTAVFVTTDKVYDNKEWVWPYREQDALGGHEPYAASKAGAELVIAAYRKTYFTRETEVQLSSVRAGNVIGGGDWATDRLIPDAIRAFRQDAPLVLRNPTATRPWQHVFEPLFGYLEIAMALHNGATGLDTLNFGPDMKDVKSVGEVSHMMTEKWGRGAKITVQIDNTIGESQLLALDNALARKNLGWVPTLSLEDTIEETVSWYKAYHEGADMLKFSLNQLNRFENRYFAQKSE